MSEQTNRLAVSASETAALKLGWFFRPQEVSDQGIDAHIEKFKWAPAKDGRPYEVGTGRLIAVQIKGGRSYFDEPSPNGWWFRFGEDKLKLWLGHALPVIVVLVNVATGELYWQRVSPRTVVEAGDSYKIEVPRSQRVEDADTEWVDIASGLERHAESRFEYSLQSLPPDVQNALSRRSEGEVADASLLAMHLAEGRLNPRGTVAALLATSPGWVTRNADWAWATVGNYSSDHGIHDLAVEAFERSAAAADGARRTRSLVAASLLVRETDPARCSAFLEQAEQSSGDDIILAVARTATSTPVGDAGPWTVDPQLMANDDSIANSAPARRALAVTALRMGNHDDAIEHGQAALAIDPQSSESMSELATSLLSRYASTGQAGDVLEAIEHLEALISQRKTWAGPTRKDEVRLAEAHMLVGNLEGAVKTCLPPPFGHADPAALDPECLRIGVRAARGLGRTDIVDHVVGLMGDEVSDQLTKVSVGALDLPADEVVRLRRAALEEAIEDDAPDEIARLGVSLSADGVDVREQLRPYADRSVLPSKILALCEALLTAAEDLDQALPRLRELAKSDAVAGEFLIGLLQNAGRHREAAEAAGVLYDVTSSEVYLLQRANCLIDAGARDEAVDAALRAVTGTSIRPVDRGRLLTFLGGEAAEAGDWAKAEAYLTQVLELFSDPASGHVWRVVFCLVNQGRLKKAAKLIAKHRPEVRNRDDAELWLRAHSVLRWDERTAMDAYGLAERFDDDPELSTALLGHIVFNTHGVGDAAKERAAAQKGSEARNGDDRDTDLEELDDAELERRRTLAQGAVPGELHRRAFELMEKLVKRHGDAAGIQVLKASDETALADQIVSQLKRGAESQAAIEELIALARHARIPLGFVAGVFHRGYTSTVLQRSFGFLFASSPDDGEHDGEVAAARAAFEQSVVVDVSTVVTLTGLDNPGELTGRFLSQFVPTAAMLDLHRASFDVRGLAGSPGSFHWDPEREGIIISELDETEFRRLLARAELIDSYTERLSVRAVSNLTLVDKLGDDPEHRVWVDALELAADLGVALWSDDLGLRRMARAFGIAAFGTPAVVDAIRDAGLEDSTSAEARQAVVEYTVYLNRRLARDFIVDLPLYAADILAVAEEEGWAAQSGAIALSRPAWWIANPDGVALLGVLYQRSRASAADERPRWQMAAMYGIAQAFQPEAASGLLALLALRGFDGATTDQERAGGLRRARRIADDFGHPDPAAGLQAAANMLAEAGECDDPDEVVERVLSFLDDVPEPSQLPKEAQ